MRLIGPLLISNLFDFQARVRADASRYLIIDLSRVPYMDSAGLGARVGAYVTHQKDGRTLSLVGVSDRVRSAMEVAHVEPFFRMFESLADAQKACA